MSVQWDLEALAARVLDAPPSVGPVRLVCVDGPSGAGKTTLASDLATLLSAHVGVVPVVHGDEVYEGWDVVADEPDPVRAFTILGERVAGWLLRPWSQGAPAPHPVWDWTVGGWGGTVEVPASSVVVLEGVGMAGAALRGSAALTVWVDADEATRVRRVAARDGASVDVHMSRWRERESLWLAADGTALAADVRVRTDDVLGPGGRPLAEPHVTRLAIAHPLRDEILAAHDLALAHGEDGYVDPASGWWVFSAAHLLDRGSCCESGCRHCPYV